jgi:hypothetical protein
LYSVWAVFPSPTAFLTDVAEYCYVDDSLPHLGFGCAGHPLLTVRTIQPITISGQPNDFTVHIGIGKFIQNLAVAAVETLLLSALFLAVDVPEMLWTRHVENEIIKEIKQIVG